MQVYLVTDYRGFLRQSIRQYLSLDIDIIKDLLEKNGYNVEITSFEEIANSDEYPKNSIILYTSSQDINYKYYIDDVLSFISKYNNTLVPNYDIFRCHENKGYQELHKKVLEISSLNNKYFGNLKGLETFKNEIKDYPIVMKKVSGAGSSNVIKINNEFELFSKAKIINKYKVSYIERIKIWLAKNVFKDKYNEDYYKDDFNSGQFILQEFVPNLSEDWKVLIFWDKFYVLNRKIRENDFRASGSGKLGFIDPPSIVLDYAKEVFKKLDVPFVSLDISYDGINCQLIEFQGMHFGPYTIVNSEWYYSINSKNEWIKTEKKSILEEEYAISVIRYLENKRM